MLPVPVKPEALRFDFIPVTSSLVTSDAKPLMSVVENFSFDLSAICISVCSPHTK